MTSIVDLAHADYGPGHRTIDLAREGWPLVTAFRGRSRTGAIWAALGMLHTKLDAATLQRTHLDRSHVAAMSGLHKLLGYHFVDGRWREGGQPGRLLVASPPSQRSERFALPALFSEIVHRSSSIDDIERHLRASDFAAIYIESPNISGETWSGQALKRLVELSDDANGAVPLIVVDQSRAFLAEHTTTPLLLDQWPSGVGPSRLVLLVDTSDVMPAGMTYPVLRMQPNVHTEIDHNGKRLNLPRFIAVSNALTSERLHWARDRIVENQAKLEAAHLRALSCTFDGATALLHAGDKTEMLIQAAQARGLVSQISTHEGRRALALNLISPGDTFTRAIDVLAEANRELGRPFQRSRSRHHGLPIDQTRGRVLTPTTRPAGSKPVKNSIYHLQNFKEGWPNLAAGLRGPTPPELAMQQRALEVLHEHLAPDSMESTRSVLTADTRVGMRIACTAMANAMPRQHEPFERLNIIVPSAGETVLVSRHSSPWLPGGRHSWNSVLKNVPPDEALAMIRPGQLVTVPTTVEPAKLPFLLEIGKRCRQVGAPLVVDQSMAESGSIRPRADVLHHLPPHGMWAVVNDSVPFHAKTEARASIVTFGNDAAAWSAQTLAYQAGSPDPMTLRDVTAQIVGDRAHPPEEQHTLLHKRALQFGTFLTRNGLVSLPSYEPQEPLANVIRNADVLGVGFGIGALSAANHFAAEGARVVLLTAGKPWTSYAAAAQVLALFAAHSSIASGKNQEAVIRMTQYTERVLGQLNAEMIPGVSLHRCKEFSDAADAWPGALLRQTEAEVFYENASLIGPNGERHLVDRRYQWSPYFIDTKVLLDLLTASLLDSGGSVFRMPIHSQQQLIELAQGRPVFVAAGKDTRRLANLPPPHEVGGEGITFRRLPRSLLPKKSHFDENGAYNNGLWSASCQEIVVACHSSGEVTAGGLDVDPNDLPLSSDALDLFLRRIQCLADLANPGVGLGDWLVEENILSRDPGVRAVGSHPHVSVDPHHANLHYLLDLGGIGFATAFALGEKLMDVTTGRDTLTRMNTLITPGINL